MSRSDNELIDFCASDDLSFDALQEKINALGPQLSSQDPSCFHEACRNKKVTLEIVQLLYNTFPEALRLRDDAGYHPIHRLCLHKDLDDTTSFDILRFMLNIDPTLLREVDGDDNLPIHNAAESNKSPAFSKILIDAYPESLRIESRGWVPIHIACARGERVDTADTIQYMLELDPELINAENRYGYLPIHCAAMYGRTKSIELLLKYDPDAASKEISNGRRQGWLPIHCAAIYGRTKSIELLLRYDPDAASKEINNGSGRLPLHLSSGYIPNLSSVQVLYDAYPEAILAGDEFGITPLDLAHSNRKQSAIDFLQTQLVYAQQAQDLTAMTTVDENGWLPLHHALKDNASLGSIKLLVNGNPAFVHVSDQNETYPLHIACKFSSVNVVKYLVELAGDTMELYDTNKESPLHYACRSGNLGVIKYLLQANVPSVSERNNNNKLAIRLLFECYEDVLDKESMGYVETVWQLLLANPEVVWDFMSN